MDLAFLNLIHVAEMHKNVLCELKLNAHCAKVPHKATQLIIDQVLVPQSVLIEFCLLRLHHASDCAKPSLHKVDFLVLDESRFVIGVSPSMSNLRLADLCL